MLLLMLATAWLSLPAIGIRAGQLAGAVAPGLAASAAMAILVSALSAMLPPMAAPARLAVLVTAGVSIYAALLLAFARPIVDELFALVRKAPAAQAG
jgi:hypothetical protein